MWLTVPVCPLINLSDISIFAVIMTLVLTFNTINVTKPTVSNYFRF